MGVIYAGPVSDGIAFIIAVILLVIEMKNLGKQTNESYIVSDEVNTKNQNSNIIITN